MKQLIFNVNEKNCNNMDVAERYREIKLYLQKINAGNILVVCGKSLEKLGINEYIAALEKEGIYNIFKFSDFSPNPKYESVVQGIKELHKYNCDTVLAIGGGSAMDVAKCIKLYSNMDDKINYLKQNVVANDIHLLAVPTTSGTGSEATRYAVIYYEDEKQSISHDSIIPEAVFFDATVLKTLPLYQKKATMMDAMCHAVEAYWSVNSTDESKEYSRKAIKMILENMDTYLEENTNEENETIGSTEKQAYYNMFMASNFAGRAINITQTTAGHAMCYKLTGLYGISHGHAAALCVNRLWRYMALEADGGQCIDPRGCDYLLNVFEELSEAFGVSGVEAGPKAFDRLCKGLEFDIPSASEEEIHKLKTSVNPVRLKNNPVQLESETIEMLYRDILK